VGSKCAFEGFTGAGSLLAKDHRCCGELEGADGLAAACPGMAGCDDYQQLVATDDSGAQARRRIRSFDVPKVGVADADKLGDLIGVDCLQGDGDVGQRDV